MKSSHCPPVAALLGYSRCTRLLVADCAVARHGSQLLLCVSSVARFVYLACPLPPFLLKSVPGGQGPCPPCLSAPQRPDSTSQALASPDRGWDSLCGQTLAGDDTGRGPVKSLPPQDCTARAEGDHGLGLVPVLSARANRSTCRPSPQEGSSWGLEQEQLSVALRGRQTQTRHRDTHV